MTWRRALLALFAALIAAVALLGSAAIALGATPQERTDDVAAWMSGALHVPVASRPTVVTNELGQASSAGEFWGDGTIRMRPEYAGAAPIGVYVRTHELAHKQDTIDGCYQSEEAIVDAMARDLFAAAALHFAGYIGGPVSSAYDERGPNGEASVGDVRVASARATGQRWGSRAARLWRRALWAQGCDGRAAMLGDVGS